MLSKVTTIITILSQKVTVLIIATIIVITIIATTQTTNPITTQLNLSLLIINNH